jgi:hypothetical protein
MTKANIWWNTANSIAIFALWFFILFTYGEFPLIKDRITTVENKVEAIDYHLQCPNAKCDTIVINNYFQQPVKKK